VLLRRLLAAVAILASLAALACTGMAVLRWREHRAASAAAVALSQPQEPSAAAAPAAPEAAAAPTVARRLGVAWHDGDGRPLRSRISIDSAGGALVETLSGSQALVSYRGTVRTRPDGTLIIDASDAAVSGAAAAEWIADSFAIRADGSVTIHDGRNPACSGYLSQESTQR